MAMTTITGLETLRVLQAHFIQGNLSREEFDKRRLAIVDALTGTKYEVHVETAPPTTTVENLGAHGTTDEHHVGYQFITARVPKGMEAISNRLELAKKDPAFQKKDGAVEIRDWEIFHAAANNNVKRLAELAEAGVSLEMRDLDTGATPLIIAGSRSQRQALMWLVEHGADVNAQNHQGLTALHMCIQNKQAILAVWLVRQGADPYLEDSRHFSAYDLALPWMQSELKEALDSYMLAQYKRNQPEMPTAHSAGPPLGTLAAGSISTLMSSAGAFSGGSGGGGGGVVVHPPPGSPVVTPPPPPPSGSISALPPLGNPERPAGAGSSKVMRVYLKNNAYKALMVTDSMKAGDVCALMAEKMGMPEFAPSLELIDCIKTNERRLDPNVNVFRIIHSWPVIINTGDATMEEPCRLKVVPVRGASEAVAHRYRSAMYGK